MEKNKLEVLESLRGLAALYVMFHHMTLKGDSWWSFPFAEGQAAVILFFVLSGFVIFYSSHKFPVKEFLFGDYFIKRFRRIYPIFIVSLLVAYFARCISLRSFIPIDDGNLIGNIFNLQDIKRIPNNWVSPYYGNNPLWSLSYEWWFYLLFFPIYKYLPEKFQIGCALMLSVLGYITFQFYNNKISITLEYFFIWWSGVEIARIWISNKKIEWKSLTKIGIGYAIMIVLCLISVLVYKGKLNIENDPVIEFRHYCYGALIILIGIFWKNNSFVGYKYILRPFLAFSSISYGIYVFHAPLVYKNENLFSDNFILNCLFGFIATIILAFVFEVPVQKWINHATNKLFKTERSKMDILATDDGDKLLPG